MEYYFEKKNNKQKTSDAFPNYLTKLMTSSTLHTIVSYD